MLIVISSNSTETILSQDTHTPGLVLDYCLSKKGRKSALTTFAPSLWSNLTRVPNMYCTIQNEIKTGQKN